MSKTIESPFLVKEDNPFRNEAVDTAMERILARISIERQKLQEEHERHIRVIMAAVIRRYASMTNKIVLSVDDILAHDEDVVTKVNHATGAIEITLR